MTTTPRPLSEMAKEKADEWLRNTEVCGPLLTFMDMRHQIELALRWGARAGFERGYWKGHGQGRFEASPSAAYVCDHVGPLIERALLGEGLDKEQP